MRVILNFFQDRRSGHIQSCTLGRIAFVTRAFSGPRPAGARGGDWWECEIVSETLTGHKQGFFLVRPCARIEKGYSSLSHLLPGMYIEHYVHGTNKGSSSLILIPRPPPIQIKTNDPIQWLIQNELRRSLLLREGVRSVVVPHTSPVSWVRINKTTKVREMVGIQEDY